MCQQGKFTAESQRGGLGGAESQKIEDKERFLYAFKQTNQFFMQSSGRYA
jgi:hypothetical protein